MKTTDDRAKAFGKRAASRPAMTEPFSVETSGLVWMAVHGTICLGLRHPALVAVAFLLEASSDEGIRSEGAAANGFAQVLRDAAKDAARLRRELLKLREELETPSSEE